MLENRLITLQRLGQSVWIDFISRDALASGELARLVADGVLGLTSNPAIFERAIATGKSYDADIAGLVSEGCAVDEIYERLAIADITAAADLLRPVYNGTGGLDGYVSLEVSPRLAHNTIGTIADARRLWAAVNRPNLMIKVPGTPEGIPAIRELIATGLNVNVTLLFALSAYEAAASAYIEGLEERDAGGLPIGDVASVASFFVSRVDAVVDGQLTGHLEKTSCAVGRRSPTPGWRMPDSRRSSRARAREALAAPDARVQRPLWASTSTKDRRYSDTLYVDELIGPHTVNTMPPQTVAAFKDHGLPAETITKDLEGSRALMRVLASIGIDMDLVTDGLLIAGVQAFAEAYERLVAGLAAKMATE